MSRFWQELKTTDFDETTSSWIAVLPVAAIEQHGPHLPLGTDSMIAEAMVARVSKQLPSDSPAVFLPVQEIGKSTEHMNFKGTLSLNWETTTRLWLDIGNSLARTGVRKLLIITSHGGNVANMDIVARELRLNHNMLVITTSWEKLALNQIPRTDKEPNIDIHGGAFETSIMLAVRPDCVDMEKAQSFASAQSETKATHTHLGYHSSNANISWLAEDLNPAGTVGDAASASKDEGEKIVKVMSENFIQLVDEIGSHPLPKA